jgi:glycosyltransferase involved in cell wall biosynthesis
VIHACEYARDVLPVIETQLTGGMRPYIVTPQGGGSAELYLSGRPQEQPRSLSLLRSWQDVRNWRKSILECDPESSADLVHAHCFAAGMAAVRSTGGVVYDLGACIEELALAAGQCEPGSWMGRSFRVAEQFVLSRAASVIVHSSALRDAAKERGALAENTFLIPDPIADDDAVFNGAFDSGLKEKLGVDEGRVVFFVPNFAARSASSLGPEHRVLLESFARAAGEKGRFHLLLETAAPEPIQQAIRESAAELGIGANLVVLPPEETPAAWLAADVVVTGDGAADAVEAKRVNRDCLAALGRGKALLAAEIPRNREASPDGRGCLWYSASSPAELAQRMEFLGRNAEFRRALGTAGKAFICESRSAVVIAKKYHEAYQHAFMRRKSTGPGTGMATLQPAANWG